MNAFEEAFGAADPYVPHKTRVSDIASSKRHCHKDRGLEAHQALLGFSVSELAVNSALLVIGSGATRKFERQLYEERPDILAVSVDPLLAYGVQERHLESIRQGGKPKGSGWIFPTKADNFPSEIAVGRKYFRRGAVSGGFLVRRAGEAEEQAEPPFSYLPFKSSTFDVVLALHSIPQYISPDYIPAAIHDIARVAKPGGRVALYPILNPDIPVVNAVMENAAHYMGDPRLDVSEHTYCDGPGPDEAKRLSFTKIG